MISILAHFMTHILMNMFAAFAHPANYVKLLSTLIFGMYWYDTSSEQSTSASAATNVALIGLTGIAGLRGQVRRLQAGPNTNALDVQVRLRLLRTTTLLTAGTGITPMPAQNDQPAANAIATTLPTAGSRSAVPCVQLAFNTRGTGLWFATIEEEAKGFTGATAPNGQLVLDSTQTGTSAVAVDAVLSHTE